MAGISKKRIKTFDNFDTFDKKISKKSAKIFSIFYGEFMEKYINQIIHADCMDILKQLPDKCIDNIRLWLYNINTAIV